MSYGTTPAGYLTKTAARRLKPDVTYIISGDDVRTGAAYSGGFRMAPTGTVRSFGLNDPEVQRVLGRWLNAQDRN